MSSIVYLSDALLPGTVWAYENGPDGLPTGREWAYRPKTGWYRLWPEEIGVASYVKWGKELDAATERIATPTTPIPVALLEEK